MKIPDGYSTLFPYLMVKDAGAYITFLETVFGAVEKGRTLREGTIANARLEIQGTRFMVSEAAGLGATQSAMYLYVPDADAIHAAALAAGCTETFPCMDMDYGDRQGGVTDAWGNHWFVSTRLVDEGF